MREIDEYSNESKKPFSKSRPYPFYNISVALDMAKEIEKLGTRNVSEPVLLNKLNIKNPLTRSFSGKISSAKHFGFITTDGKGYSLTDSALLILRPKDEERKKNLLIDAFLMPDLYKEIADRFINKQLPPLDTLANIMFHDYGINPNVSKEAAKAFIESAKFIGTLGQDNVLRNLFLENKEIIALEAPENKETTRRQVDNISKDKSDHFTTTVELSKGIVSITLPKGGITRQDSERLKKFLDAVVYVVEEN